MRKRALVIGSRIALALAFIAAGWPKVDDPGVFIRDIWNFRLLPEAWAYPIAAYLPYLEIVTGVALLTGCQRRGAHVISGALLAVFFTFHASAWARGLDVSCGCFGAAAAQATASLHPVWWLAFIAALAGALFVSIRAEHTCAR